MPKYLSGRQKLRASNKLTEDRYQYLGLDQAEPNLADPLTSPGVPSGTQYQLVAVAGYDGRRYWVPVGGAVIPGAITIFDEGTPVSSASSITQVNFVGAAVTAQVSVQSPSGHPGIAATVTVVPVTVGDSPPNIPNPNNGELWWESDTGDLYVYYNDGNSAQWVMANSGGRGLTGDKGEVGPKGEKGQKGEVGNTGSQGDKGEKGAPSTVVGPKGQKGEIGIGQKGEPSTVKGDKGQKGEIGPAGNDGNNGDKGQKGDSGSGGGGASVTISDTAPGSASNGDLWWESDTFDLHVYYQDGSSNQWVSITSNAALKGEKGDTGTKGQKGEIGQKGDTGDKGQKGEIGPAGGSGGAGAKGDKGQKGQDGTDASGAKGQKGEPSTVKGEKGQKGEVGATGTGTGTADKIFENDTSVECVDTGTGVVEIKVDGTETITVKEGEVGINQSNPKATLDISRTSDNYPTLNLQGGNNTYGDLTVESGEILQTGHWNRSTGTFTERFRIGTKGALGIEGNNYGTSGQVLTSKGGDYPPGWVNASNVAGLKGQKGEVGSSGSNGSDGSDGDKGQKGEAGSAASKGQKGEAGTNGSNGSDGSDGDKGQKGDKGQTGATGSQTFTVTNSGASAYQIDGSNNPTLTLVRGFTYTFNVNASGHPFYIKTSASTGTGNQYTTGVTNNGVQVGTLTFVVPSNAPATLYYICQYHSSMVGTINTVENGQKGEKGQKGDTGAQGSSGSDGSDGDKGQKGATGSGGSGGAKGQKGEVGAQGAGGSAGSDGSDGDKGQKGEAGAAASKGQKGEVGATGGSGGTGAKGQKGEVGADGGSGADGSDGSKGQKGEAGAGQTPAIVATQRSSDFTVSSTSFQDVMSVTINPTVSGSKLLVTAGGGGKGDIDTNDESNSHNLESTLQLQVYRGSTAIGQQANMGAGGEGFYIAIVDTNNHGGNNVTYTVKAKVSQGFHIDNVDGKVRKASSLMIQEII